MRKIQKKGIVFSWLLSYLIILMIPVVANISLFIGSENIIEEKITVMNKQVLTQIQHSLDNMFESINRNALEIETSAEMAGAMMAQRKLTADDHYRFYLLNSYLKRCNTYSDFIEDILVFLHIPGYCITSLSSFDPSVYGTLQLEYNLSHENIEWICSKEKRGFYLLPDSKELSRCFLIAPLLDAGRESVIGHLVVVPKEKYFHQKIIREGNTLQKAVFLSDGKNMLPLDSLPDWLTEAGNPRTSLKSDFANLEYIVVDRHSQIYKEIKVLRSLLYVSIAVSLGMGFLFAFYFTNKNYSPVKQLVTFIAGHLNMKKEHETNEYHFLENAVTQTIQMKEETEAQLFLLRILQGNPIPEPVRRKMFTFRYYIVINYAIEDSSEFFQNGERVPNNHHLLSSVISNCAKDFLGNAVIFDLIEFDRNFIQILCYNDSNEQDIKSSVFQKINCIHTFFNEHLRIKLSIGIGNLCNRPEEIHYSYEKARDALEDRILRGNNVVIDCKDIVQLTLSYDYSIEDEKNIITSLIDGNYEQSRTLLFQLIDHNLLTNSLSSQLAHCMLFDIVGTVMKALSLTKMDSNLLGHLNPIDRLLSCETFDQMKDELSDIILNVCNYINRKKASPNRKMFDNVLSYIEQHYSDPTLSVQELGDSCYLSKTVLMNLFKDYLHCTPLDYITRLRCEKAAQMLQCSGKKVEEIAENVGYSGSHSFIRAFKKVYGQTPGNYRMLSISEKLERDSQNTNESR